MRVVVALACLYAGVAISDPRPGTEVSRPAGRQPFPFWGRKKDDESDDDDESGSGSDNDDAPRLSWSAKAAQAQRPGRERDDDDDRGSFLANLLRGKGGGGGNRRPSPWDRFSNRDDDDDDEDEKKGRRGRDDEDGDRKSRGRGGRGGDSDDDSGGDSDNEEPTPKPPGRGKEGGKEGGKGKGRDEMAQPKSASPKGPAKEPKMPGGGDEMTRPKGPSPKGPAKEPKMPGGRDGPPLQQAGPAPSPPQAGSDTYKGLPRVPKLADKAPPATSAPPAAKPKAEGGRPSTLPTGSSPPERYARLAGSPGNGIWRQAPTGGGQCPMGIYHPKPYTTFQYLLNSRIDVRAPLLNGIETYILDLFATTEADITNMHQQGRKVICYFNAGGSQDDNPDNWKFNGLGVTGGKIAKEPGKGFWPGEHWVDTSSPKVRQIMFDRIKEGHKRGCLGFEFDNVDAYENNNGLKKGSMTLAKAAEYVKVLCAEAHKYCMSCNLKNSAEMVPLVNSTVQYYVNEECVRYKHCNAYDKVGLSKPIFHIEYTTGKLMGAKSQIIPGSNLQPGEDGDDGDDDDDDKNKRKNSAGGWGGQRGGAPKFGGDQSGAPKRGGGQSGAAKRGGGQSGGGQSGWPKSGGLFSGFFGKLMRGKGRRLSKRAEQVEQADLAGPAEQVELAEPTVGRAAQADKLDGGNKGEHANGQAWYCPKINGMTSILGHEGLEGEIQTCGGIVHKSRVRG